MINKVLVICIGNICRSPMAVALLRHHAPHLQVESAGLKACVGEDMHALTAQVLSGNQIARPAHAACQLTDERVRWADLILVMDQRQLRSITDKAPHTRGKTFLIGKWRDDFEIDDPYRRPLSAFQRTYTELTLCIEGWLPYLSSEDRQR
jgi:protein-tyrosine phosphatase